MASFRTVLLPSTDLAASKALYTALLGAEPTADSEYYVGFDVDGQHIGLVPGGPETTVYLHVDDLAAAVQAVVDAGGSVQDAPKQVGGGRTVGVVLDASGARIGLLSDAG